MPNYPATPADIALAIAIAIAGVIGIAIVFKIVFIN